MIESLFWPTGRQAGRVVLKLSGVDSIEAAETIAGRELLLSRADLPALEPDTFLVGDLVDCLLFNCDTPVGRVLDVEFVTSADGRLRREDTPPLLVVERSSVAIGSAAASSSEEPALIPFARAWLRSVDLEARQIHMILPEGLLDLDTFVGPSGHV